MLPGTVGTALNRYLDKIESIHEQSKFQCLEDFFIDGFKLTDDDRFKNFRLEYSPWISELCKWFDDPETPWIYLVQGSQTTKTTFLMGVLLYIAQYVRGAVPVLWVQSVEEEAKLFVTERLRPFLDEAGQAAIKKRSWKQTAFRVFNAAVKIGYATTKVTLRSKPARFVIGDECSLWKETIAYTKKRTRTFAGKRKGIYATTPPEDGEHHSWREATAGNFYQWWVPCPECLEFQGLKFSQLKWCEKDPEGWDFDKVKESARYNCEHCGAKWDESYKLKLINAGKAVCIDYKTGKPKKASNSDSKTMQVSSLYSLFSTWGEVACMFLEAKAAGPQTLKVFFTDELAEPAGDLGTSFIESELAKFIKTGHEETPEVYNLYTAGIDVQRLGVLYYVIMGWKAGAIVSGHVLSYGVIPWKDEEGRDDWSPLLEVMANYKAVQVATIDSSDGEVTTIIYDFCNWAGAPFVPLKDSAQATEKVKYKIIEVTKRTKQRQTQGQRVLVVNSNQLKDDMAAAFRRLPGEPGAWSFPPNTSEEFLRHLTNEHRTFEKKRGGRTVSVWRPKYKGAPQHYFSAQVYAAAAMEEFKRNLQICKQAAPAQKFRRVRSKGLESWQ
ncbi:phage terminase large subunit family protein [Candidatus Pacearchaeota archaeon]|nr:phage terminase large subunit family protein [Candidatus Pacearchaeota archaeon]